MSNPDPQFASLRDRLRRADERLSRDPSSWNGAALRTRARRRTIVRRASAIAAIAALIAVAVLIGPTLQRRRPPIADPSSVSAPSSLLAEAAAIESLQQEIDYEERVLAFLRLAEARKPTPTPVVLSHEAEREGSAWLAVRLVEQRREAEAKGIAPVSDPASEVKIRRDRYREVTRFFPGTQAAELAQRRLDEISSL